MPWHGKWGISIFMEELRPSSSTPEATSHKGLRKHSGKEGRCTATTLDVSTSHLYHAQKHQGSSSSVRKCTPKLQVRKKWSRKLLGTESTIIAEWEPKAQVQHPWSIIQCKLQSAHLWYESEGWLNVKCMRYTKRVEKIVRQPSNQMWEAWNVVWGQEESMQRVPSTIIPLYDYGDRTITDYIYWDFDVLMGFLEDKTVEEPTGNRISPH